MMNGQWSGCAGAARWRGAAARSAASARRGSEKKKKQIKKNMCMANICDSQRVCACGHVFRQIRGQCPGRPAARRYTPNMQLRHPSNPHASKVSRRVELMTTALKTMRRITTKNPRERLVAMTAGANKKLVWGENEGWEEKRVH